MHTIVEIPQYSRKADKLLSEIEKNEIISYLAFHPKAGEILTGTGGIRKIRWKREGKGNSGGVRIIYYNQNKNNTLLLLSLFCSFGLYRLLIGCCLISSLLYLFKNAQNFLVYNFHLM